MASDKVTDNYVQSAIARFDGHYDHWSMLMENFLRFKEDWTLVETGIVEPESEIVEPESGMVLTELQQKKLDESKLKDLKVKRSILQALRKDFETLQMKQGESVNDYFSKAMAIANKMSIHGEKMEDVTIVEKILRSMTTKFDYVVCSIKKSNDVEQLSIDELQSSLLVHEQKINRSTSEEHALKVSTNSDSSASRGRCGRGRGRGRGGSHERGRGSKDGNKSNDDSSNKDTYDSGSSNRGYNNSGGNSSRGQRQPYNHDLNVDKSNVECFRCGNYGHYRSECYTNMNKAKGARANFA
ncbi:uncharacterized protein LOC117638629 [Prunus dulcis]|uniref:uncharacterized protein LOC117638629 n=1 Tax=Prunus dulcis TaxID=3755 RepID=UPI0014825EB1|nr:uncharacterized protein LOC117638629 [Prunus dulcis]